MSSIFSHHLFRELMPLVDSRSSKVFLTSNNENEMAGNYEWDGGKLKKKEKKILLPPLPIRGENCSNMTVSTIFHHSNFADQTPPITRLLHLSRAKPSSPVLGSLFPSYTPLILSTRHFPITIHCCCGLSCQWSCPVQSSPFGVCCSWTSGVVRLPPPRVVDTDLPHHRQVVSSPSEIWSWSSARIFLPDVYLLDLWVNLNIGISKLSYCTCCLKPNHRHHWTVERRLPHGCHRSSQASTLNHVTESLI